MIRVETAYHIITASANKKPDYACIGKCKSVWWSDEVNPHLVIEAIKCPKCGGDIRKASKNNYRIIERTISPNSINRFGVRTTHAVKPDFEDMAKREWC